MKYSIKNLYLMLAAALLIGSLAFISSVAAKNKEEGVSIIGFHKQTNAYEFVSAAKIYTGLMGNESSDSFISEPSTRFRCGQALIDRDKFKYSTLQVGTQCWLGQNLRTKTGPDGQLLTMGTATSQRDCITTSNTRGTEADCQARGALYNLATAKTICPSGWRLPNENDFRTLETYLTDKGNECDGHRGYWGNMCGNITSPDGCSNAGQKLKEGGSSAFEWKLTGRRTVNPSLVSSFTGAGITGYAWSQSQYGCTASGMPGSQPYNYVPARSVSSGSTAVTREAIPLNYWNIFTNTEVVYTDYQALPVRCVRDY